MITHVQLSPLTVQIDTPGTHSWIQGVIHLRSTMPCGITVRYTSQPYLDTSYQSLVLAEHLGSLAVHHQHVAHRVEEERGRLSQQLAGPILLVRDERSVVPVHDITAVEAGV